jgi:hypothetical protein
MGSQEWSWRWFEGNMKTNFFLYITIEPFRISRDCGGGRVQVVESLPSKYKVLNSNLSTAKTKQTEY